MNQCGYSLPWFSIQGILLYMVGTERVFISIQSPDSMAFYYTFLSKRHAIILKVDNLQSISDLRVIVHNCTSEKRIRVSLLCTC